MKVVLRILVILLSIGIVIAALLPLGRKPPDGSTPETTSTSPTPSPTPSHNDPPQQNVIRDLLGGAALDSGKKAKDMIGEINSQRRDQFDSLEENPDSSP